MHLNIEQRSAGRRGQRAGAALINGNHLQWHLQWCWKNGRRATQDSAGRIFLSGWYSLSPRQNKGRRAHLWRFFVFFVEKAGFFVKITKLWYF